MPDIEVDESVDYDLCDAIIDYLYARPDRDFSPSYIARGVRRDTNDVHRALRHLVAAVEVNVSGNGAWTRYSNRRYIGRQEA